MEAILLLGSARGAGLIVTIARSKVLAIFLGTGGVGLLGLLRTFLDPLANLLQFGVNAGVVKFVAQHRAAGDEAAVRATISTAAWFFLAVASAALFLVLVFSRMLAIHLFESEHYRHLIILSGLSLPLTVFAAFFNACLIGAQRIGTITRIHYVGHAVALVVTIPLIVFYGLTGAVAGLLALELFYCAAYGLAAARHVPVNMGSFHAGTLLTLSSYGVATLADSGCWLLVFFVARLHFTKRFGFDANGLYQIIFLLSFNYLSVLLFAINTYLLPRIAALADDRGTADEVNTALRGVWLMMAPVMVALTLFIRPLIWLFSTREFYDAAAFLPWQLVGDVFFLTWAVAGLGLLGRGRLRAFIAIGVARSVIFIAAYFAIEWAAGRIDPEAAIPGTPAAFAGLSGWRGLVWAYALSGIVASALALAALKTLYGFTLRPENRFLIGLSACAMLPVLFLPNAPSLAAAAKIAAVLVWLPLVVRRAEWRAGWRWGRELLSRSAS